MGISDLQSRVLKRKFRWTLSISGTVNDGVNTLLPLKAARPSLSFKDLTPLEHFSETIYFPGKPEWKPIDLTLYDTQLNLNPIINWISLVYQVCSKNNAGVYPSINDSFSFGFKKNVNLNMLDGAGNVCEQWEFQNAYPSLINFGDVDYTSNDYMTIDLTLRYDRAKLISDPNCSSSNQSS